MNLKEICLALAREIHKLVPYDRAAINLPLEGNCFRVYAEESRLPASAIPEGVSTVDGTATGWAVEHREPVTCRNVLEDDRFPLTHERYAAVGIRSYVILPLLAKNQVLGVLNLGSMTAGRFGAKEIAVLSPITEILSLAIENSRLYEESQKREEMQKLLKELSQDITALDIDSLLQKLTKQVRAVLGADVSDVRLMEKGAWRSIGVSGTEPESLQPGAASAGRGLSRSVLQNRRTLAIPDMVAAGLQGTRHGFRGYVGVPLLSRSGEVIGVLRVLNYRARHFSQDEVDLLEQLAGGAAIAIENARLFEEVQKKSLELEDAFKLKTDFWNTMAHELRTPLNVVIGTQQLLLDGAYGPLMDEQRRATQRLGRCAGDLLALINEILDLMRLEAKKVPVHCEEFSADDLTDEMEASFDPLAREKGLRLEFVVGPGMPRMHSDRAKVREILQNLLANAVKYTEKGKVELRVRPETQQADGPDRRVSWSVSDTGIGIGKSALPHVLEPFYMAEGVDRKKYPGSGLGLNIVKRLVELLDGDVRIESALGKGSTFTVTLPAVHRTKQE